MLAGQRGFAGLMGAGRTEFARSLFGKSWGTNISGKVFVNGKEIQVNTIKQAIDNGLAYATEDRKRFGLNLIDDIKRNISIASLDDFVKRGLVNDNEEFKVASEYRTSMNIKAPSVLSVVGKLSGGNQQKVVLSQWINVKPEVLILDEPTRGIDVGAKYEIYTIIQRLADEGLLPALETGRELGAGHVLAVGFDTDPQRLHDNFCRLCQSAAALDMQVALEFISYCSIATLAQALDLVRSSGQPNARLLDGRALIGGLLNPGLCIATRRLTEVGTVFQGQRLCVLQAHKLVQRQFFDAQIIV